MIYLNKKALKPSVIVLSVVFVPLILITLIWMIAAFHVAALILFFMLSALYGAALYLAYRHARSTKNYLALTEQYIEIVYPEVNFERGLLQLPYEAIVEFTHYKMISWEALKNLVNYGAMPNCVYITYVSYGRQVKELIGHLDYNEIKEIADACGVPLQAL